MGNVVTSIISDWRERFTPFMGWIGELKQGTTLKADAIAGITVALVLVPQSMAYAQLAGLPAYVGLYASFLPVVIAALFGSSRQLATGPVAIVSLMTAASLEPLATGGIISGVGGYIAYASILALMVGVFQLSLGLFKLGVLVDFLSHPVVIGFTNAAAIIIGTSQLNKIFGVTVEKGEHHHETVRHIFEAIPDTHLITFAVGILSIFILLYMKEKMPKLPNVLTVVIITTLLSYFIGFEQMGGEVIGNIQGGLPGFNIPFFHVDVNSTSITGLIVPALIISVLGFVEAISVAKAISSQTRQRLSSNQELVGQGLGNLTSGFFQGYAVSGSFSRSAVNFAANAKTGFSSVITGVLVAVTLLFLTPLLHHLPQATLAAVIIVAVMNLIKFKPIVHAWKVQPHDGVIAVFVFIATLVTAPHLETGIMVGIVMSLGLYLYRTMTPHFAEVARHEDGTLREADLFELETSDTVGVYRYDGDLYFANTGYLEGKLLNAIASKPDMKVLILDLEAVAQVDATGEEMLSNLADRLMTTGIEFYVARAKKPILDAFERSGLYHKIGEERFTRERTDAARDAKEKLGDAIDIEPLLSVKHKEICS